VSFVSNDFVVGATPIYLEGGFPTQLTNVELGPYFEYQNLQGVNPNQYAQPLPEGIYTLSFEVYDFATNKKLSKKSSVTTIIFQNEPPFLNLPVNKAEIVEQNIQNIIFSWTPRSINVSNVEYEFSLVEIWNTNTPLQNAFAYSQPLYTTTTRNTTVQYSIAEPQLIPGKTYAWRVKAKALVGAEEIGVFKNNGYSEIFSFKYLTFCKAPLAITTTDVSQDQAKVTWSGEVDNYDYQINYREKNADSKWYPLVTPREYITISNLKPKTTYEYTVGAACDPGEYTHSNIQEFTTLAQDEIAFAGCGIKPDPAALSNKTPLPALFPNDVVTAGDFPIVVLKSTGSNGTFSGEGYVTLPFLEKFKELIDAAAALAGSDEKGDSKANIGKYTRIKITFDNIGVNTDFKLISGEIVASYDPSGWDNNMLNLDDLINNLPVVDIFTPEEQEVSTEDIPDDAVIINNNTSPPVTVNVPAVITPVTTTPAPITSTPTTSPTTETPASTGIPSNPANTPIHSTTPPAEKPEFKSLKLLAIDANNKNRVAKDDETLYYVGYRKNEYYIPKTKIIRPRKPNSTTFALSTNPKVANDTEHLKWFRDDIERDSLKGKQGFKVATIPDDVTIKSIAGNPTEVTRKVDVKVVSSTSQELALVGIDIKSVIDKLKGIEKAKEELDKKLHTEFFKFKLDKVEFAGSKNNEEDKNSRLYKIVEKGALTGGVKLELAEIKFTIPPLKALSRLKIADIGLFAKASVGIKVEGGVDRFKFVESNEYQGKDWFVELNPNGCIEVGIEAKLLIAKEYVNFLAEGSAKSCVHGKLKYSFIKKEWGKGELYISPLVFAANINISAKGPIEFELIKYERSVEVTDKIPLID
jgi:hypothetical protein